MANPSVRQQLKNNIVSLLSPIKINNKSVNVFLNDPYSLEDDDLPAICIQATNEQSTVDVVGYPRSFVKVYSLEITCIYKATDDLDNTVEEFATLIQEKLSESILNVKILSVNGVVNDSTLTNILFSQFDDISENTAGAVLNYDITYYIDENNLRQTI